MEVNHGEYNFKLRIPRNEWVNRHIHVYYPMSVTLEHSTKFTTVPTRNRTQTDALQTDLKTRNSTLPATGTRYLNLLLVREIYLQI